VTKILIFTAAFIIWPLFLGLAARPVPMLLNGMIFSLMNLCYALFQDKVTFPKTFSDYEDYRSRAPFLIPNKDSIRRARETWPRPVRKEEKK